jgi:tyrosyl-tRNA synthetase
MSTQAEAPLKSDFVRILKERGYVHQCTDLAALDAAAAKGPIRAYIGFDATASSLHVGSLVQIMMLRWLQKTGHTPIVLMGGGTTKVGDPSGKDTQRSMLSVEQIDANIAGIRKAFEPFLNFGDGGARWSTMPTGWTSWAMWTSCATSARTSPSTAC